MTDDDRRQDYKTMRKLLPNAEDGHAERACLVEVSKLAMKWAARTKTGLPLKP